MWVFLENFDVLCFYLFVMTGAVGGNLYLYRWIVRGFRTRKGAPSDV